MDCPILFIIFNRLDTVKRVFERIKNSKPSKLYVASDGPRITEKGETERVMKVRKYVMSNIDWNCEVKTLFRDENKGPRYGVADAINWFFENEKMGIILEHDTLPSPDFFRFCSELLEHYKNDKKVGMISGFNPFYKEIDVSSSFFFSKYNSCWGWATWRRVWKDYDVDMKEWGELRKENILKDFSDKWLVRKQKELSFDIHFYKIHDQSWDSQFSYILYKNSLSSIVPSVNLIKNIGYNSEFSVHCKGTAPPYVQKANIMYLKFPLKYPKNHCTYPQWDAFVENYIYNTNFLTILKMYIQSSVGKNRKFKFLYNFLVNVHDKFFREY